MTAIVHIGYHKTGSTWIQERLFKANPAFHSLLTHDEAFDLFLRPNSMDYDASSVAISIGEKIVAIPTSRTPIVSSEILSGSPLTGGRESLEVATRLAAAFPEGKVIVVLRQQQDALSSLYKQYVLGGGVGNLSSFFFPPKAYSYCWFSPNHFMYDRLIRAYIDLFGRDRVLVLFYENFKIHPLGFVNEICEFSGVKPYDNLVGLEGRVHVSMSDISTMILRYFNVFEVSPTSPCPLVKIPVAARFGKAMLNRCDSLFARWFRKGHIRRYVNMHFSGEFSVSNRKLDALLNVDVRALGYD